MSTIVMFFRLDRSFRMTQSVPSLDIALAGGTMPTASTSGSRWRRLQCDVRPSCCQSPWGGCSWEGSLKFDHNRGAAGIVADGQYYRGLGSLSR